MTKKSIWIALAVLALAAGVAQAQDIAGDWQGSLTSGIHAVIRSGSRRHQRRLAFHRSLPQITLALSNAVPSSPATSPPPFPA